jgi:transcriptional regulator with XRE-family HTH domain
LHRIVKITQYTTDTTEVPNISAGTFVIKLLALQQLPKNLQLIRQLTKLSRERFGKKFGVSKDQVFSYENEKKPSQPSDLFLKDVATFAGVAVEQLKAQPLRQQDLQIRPANDEGAVVQDLSQAHKAHIGDLQSQLDFLKSELEKREILLSETNEVATNLKLLLEFGQAILSVLRGHSFQLAHIRAFLEAAPKQREGAYKKFLEEISKEQVSPDRSTNHTDTSGRSRRTVKA